MFKWLGSLVDSNEKQIKKLQPLVDEINGLESEYEKLSADELRAKTTAFKERIAQATVDTRQQLQDMLTESSQVKQKLGSSIEDSEREELEDQRKRYEERISELESEKRKIESTTMDEILPEAFAAVREAAKRTLKQRHFDVQLIGGMVLHSGKIAEMKTGEGKTLVATLPLYLNSLTGRGCHLVTVNDYLSKRDANWMGPIFHALGVSVSSIQGAQTSGSNGVSFIFDPAHEADDKRWPHMRPVTRKEAYLADITYGTNNEFGFDYLRDNMVTDLNQCVQRELNFAIVDEVDNVLIDEARTPLIISGPAEESTLKKYSIADSTVRQLRGKIITDKDEQEAKSKGLDIEAGLDYLINEKTQTVRITDEGVLKCQRRLNLKTSDDFQAEWAHLVRQAIRANMVYKKDVQYVVKDGQVIIVDEFTGRLMFGRRYSEGLHQAIEAKEIAAGERVRVKEETRTYATVTFQNYFRMYNKLAGMTGTAVTEAEEFHKIYKLEVLSIPTNRPMIRQDFTDQIYKNEQAKFKAVVNEVVEMNRQKRPVLLGTVSIEKSEILGDMLRKRGVSHQILNAKQHEKEAGIIAQAGRLGGVTVATNMAGRGVDIILGGNPENRETSEWQKEHDTVVNLGGLHVIGTERHEARRIDNQLRGRSGRQGDPGSSRFYVSVEDDIMRRFGGDRVRTVMDWVGLGEDIPIENKLVTNTIESAQVRVEGYHFDIRKHLVEYDDVVNTQRGIIYGERKKVLSGADLRSNILAMITEEIHSQVTANTGDGVTEEQIAGMLAEVNTIMPLPRDLTANSLIALKPEEIEERLVKLAETIYEAMEKTLVADNVRLLERFVMLRVIDNLWVEHLTSMDQMRQGVALHAIAQRDPLAMYKKEGVELFQNLTENIRHDVAHTIFHINIQRQPPPKQNVTQARRPVLTPPPREPATPMAKAAAASRGNQDERQPMKVEGKKVGRNDPCPCGSGKKYKFCCGK